MSDNIDERIVEMQFNNKQFEEGVQTSVKSLDNLKKGLRLDESAKSLSNLERAGKSFSLANIAEGVDSIASKFTALGVIGFTALQNITNAAINAGMQITKALTIDPIKTGFTEYETQINAIQTILANTSSKGTTMDQVNAALDQLNKYADMTIYNFTQMTRNIGTFTAAGVDLDTSVAAIKGIANLAAVSGSNSQQASMAMYQLSQALASGTVKLIDWNSVVNAGMGGQVFQDSLKETARVHGVAIDKMIKKDGSFRETLQNGWLTSEILTETLSKFTGDLNADQLKTMGYTEDQIAAIIKLGQTATDAATKVKTFTQLFDTLKSGHQNRPAGVAGSAPAGQCRLHPPAVFVVGRRAPKDRTHRSGEQFSAVHSVALPFRSAPRKPSGKILSLNIDIAVSAD
jgi:tape measure domain-containing protein